jgi:hypothetical protein
MCKNVSPDPLKIDVLDFSYCPRVHLHAPRSPFSASNPSRSFPQHIQPSAHLGRYKSDKPPYSLARSLAEDKIIKNKKYLVTRPRPAKRWAPVLHDAEECKYQSWTAGPLKRGLRGSAWMNGIRTMPREIRSKIQHLNQPCRGAFRVFRLDRWRVYVGVSSGQHRVNDAVAV